MPVGKTVSSESLRRSNTRYLNRFPKVMVELGAEIKKLEQETEFLKISDTRSLRRIKKFNQLF